MRAIAVVPVVLFHAGFQTFSGGYIGVDVFFVISGYLITSIILSEIADGKFSLAHFYERRVRRILPALLFYSALISIAASILYPPHQLKDFGQSLFANSLFLSNVFFYLETDYFNDFSETAPLLHTWSLSVEEQYYVFVPLLLLFLHRYLRKQLLLIISLLLIASLLYAQFLLNDDPSASFYLLPGRFWELATGSVLAILGSRVERAGARTAAALSTIGIGLLGFAIVAYGRTTPFPGLAAVVPVAGTALVVAFARSDNLTGKLLSSRYLVGMGLISYSWYLSHHALFAVSRVYGLSFDEMRVRVSLLVLSLLIALFSYKFIEQPFRRGLLTRTRLFVVAASLLALFATYGLFLHETDGLKDLKYRALNAETRAYAMDFMAERNERKQLWEEILKKEAAPFQRREPGRVLILGDSKSEDFYVATTLAQFYAAEFRRLRLDDACMAPHLSLLEDPNCIEEFDRAINSSVYRDSDEILLTATWQRETNDRVLDFVKRVLREGKKVSLVSTSNFNDVASLSFVVASGRVEKSQEGRFFYDNLRADQRHQYEALKRAIERENLKVRFLNKEDAFCDFARHQCTLRADARWYLWDSGHLTSNGALYFSARIKALGWYR